MAKYAPTGSAATYVGLLVLIGAVLWTVWLVVNRLRNIGVSVWWSLVMLLPPCWPIGYIVGNIGCLVLPAGYRETRKVDTSGKVVGLGLAAGFAVAFLAVVVIWVWQSVSEPTDAEKKSQFNEFLKEKGLELAAAFEEMLPQDEKAEKCSYSFLKSLDEKDVMIILTFEASTKNDSGRTVPVTYRVTYHYDGKWHAAGFSREFTVEGFKTELGDDFQLIPEDRPESEVWEPNEKMKALLQSAEEY
jgi:hypothetical protein